VGVVGWNTGSVGVVCWDTDGGVIASGTFATGGRVAGLRPPGSGAKRMGVVGRGVARLVHKGLLRIGNLVRVGCRLNDGSGEKENLLVDCRVVERGFVDGRELSGNL
jgi:hypothetical protein